MVLLSLRLWNWFILIIIHFFWLSCKHCEEFDPEYEKAARILEKDIETDEPVELAKIEGTNAGLNKKYHIPGYPHILIFKNGEHSHYKGIRNAKGKIKWIKLLLKK